MARAGVLVRTARLDAPRDILDRLGALLSDEERAEAARFRRERDRRERVVARGLLRETLSLLSAIAPTAWRFERDERGRPVLAGPGGPGRPGGIERWQFSVTHTRGLVACAVADGRAVGVDAEATTRSPGMLIDSELVLADEERRALARLEGAARVAAFYRYWTLKEAWLKARGVGLGGSMREAAFELEDSRGARLAAAAPAGEWLFMEFQPTPEHWLALTVERAATGEAVPVRLSSATDQSGAWRRSVTLTPSSPDS